MVPDETLVREANGDRMKDLDGDALTALGWRESQPEEHFPVAYTGTSDGIAWRLYVQPAIDPEDGNPDTLWWTTDDIRADEYVLLIGYTRYGPISWVGQSGHRDPNEGLAALDTAIEEFLATGDLELMNPPHTSAWDFAAHSATIPLDVAALAGIDVKCADIDRARTLFDARVCAALAAAKTLVNDSDLCLRVWVGEPNLRLMLDTDVMDKDSRPAVMKTVVELGVAIATRAKAVGLVP